MIARDAELGDLLPDDVGSALEILAYEKIGRWTRNNWVRAENPNYNAAAKKIAKGRQDRCKQDALYVRIGANGRLVSTPYKFKEEDIERELERGRSYDRFVQSAVGMIESRMFSEWRYDKIMKALTTIFGGATQEAS